MAILCKLAEPHRYTVSDWDLTTDTAGREYWMDHFAHHTDTMLTMLARQGESTESAHAFRQELLAELADLRRDPSAWGPLSVLTFDRRRERLLRKHGIADPYARVKQIENDAAIALYGDVIGELDALSGLPLVETLIRGIFAGNIFDLGSLATVKDYHEQGMDFHATRERQPKRPWLIDNFDALSDRLIHHRPYQQVLFFVDNAGADLILGCLPLARYLTRQGSRVVLAANSTPSLNDITWSELVDVLDRLAKIDTLLAEMLRTGCLSTVANGCGTPLIDLTDISSQCDSEARSSELIILEGMGRAVESNYHVRFTCDCLKIALLKDIAVARRLGGTLYDQVCRFEYGVSHAMASG